MTTQLKSELEIPQRPVRKFIAENLDASSWQAIEPYFKNLSEREINSLPDLQNWLKDWNELDVVLGEYTRWAYIKTTTDTADEKAKAALTNIYANIYPHTTGWSNKLEKKFIESEFCNQLDQAVFFTIIRKIKNGLSLFREENIPLQSELQLKQRNFDQIAGAQSVQYKGKELTVQQAQVYLKSNNREQREEVFKLINERKAQDIEKLDNLLTELIQLRAQIAKNAGFENYLEYRFKELGRFDYTPQDCLQFHRTVQEVIMPLVNNVFEEKQKQLGLDVLKPWDREVDPNGSEPLKPCENTDDLVEKTIACFNQLDPYFGERIAIMRQMGYLDLDSRKNKSPGGYNMSMPEIGVPFIFMNAANAEHDLITIVHEGGHAIHTFLSHPLELNSFKEITSEIAEVASMSMELMSMEHWNIFYSNPADLNRAQKNHLQYILSILSKTCQGDSFQYWLYANPNHTAEERRKKWKELNNLFSPTNVDWSGSETALETGYQSILHFYIVPFYYIEYAFAELGSLALWKNFKQNSAKAINDYKAALKLGYTKPIPVFYETAGAKFDFSKPYISSLAEFLKQELQKLEAEVF